MNDYVMHRNYCRQNEINPAKKPLPLYARFQEKCIKGDAVDSGSGSYTDEQNNNMTAFIAVNRPEGQVCVNDCMM